MLLIMGDGELFELRDQNVISPITGQNLNQYKNFTSNTHLQ